MGSRTCEISRFMRDVLKTAQSSKNCEKLLRDVRTFSLLLLSIFYFDTFCSLKINT